MSEIKPRQPKPYLVHEAVLDALRNGSSPFQVSLAYGIGERRVRRMKAELKLQGFSCKPPRQPGMFARSEKHDTD